MRAGDGRLAATWANCGNKARYKAAPLLERLGKVKWDELHMIEKRVHYAASRNTVNTIDVLEKFS